MSRNLLSLGVGDLAVELHRSCPEIMHILEESTSMQEARDSFFKYLNDLERHYFNIYSTEHFKDVHIAEKHIAKECIRVLKNIVRSENDKLAGFSALSKLRAIAKRKADAFDGLSEGFLLEFIHLFRGIQGKSNIFSKCSCMLSLKDDAHAAATRSRELDKYSASLLGSFKRFKTGLDANLISRREQNREEILAFFRASEADWVNPVWQLGNVINDHRIISRLTSLDKDEMDGLLAAEKHGIPVQITPYSLSLFNRGGKCSYDRAIRAQVLPTEYYCGCIASKQISGESLDYMGESSTSPVACVTRRYPQVAILKPFNSCPQICVYCQRNWEIKDLEHGQVTGKMLKEALAWLKHNRNITEVLVTGGDPLTLSSANLFWIISQLSEMKHIKRIRIGTRTLVTLPFRINHPFLETMSRFHEWGRREICIVTHVESPTEITPDVVAAVKKIKSLGMNIYNQQVFTYYNSRRYETCHLRKTLKLCGIDPYYTFNTKGKEETASFRVPIARIEQERKEEARLLPGIERLDEPVFNVPKLGKSHLRAWQDHEPLMILPDGKRVYRFYPWEERLRIADDYLYTDVSIYDYLKRLERDGEDTRDYESIWYYY
ncbi:MAG TPA: KamA family radical SAM protein [Lentisphaeria bacterium]|nr:MAG: KamA family radical SAM protein [Lentisphaerae bacterium GWF2_50_93]HCE42713.1 KamA family radical SAM protein [Lentisphaeria bacterium]